MSTSWLGDAVITIPAIHGVRSLLPDAHLAVVAKSSVADLFRAVPPVDEIIALEKQSGLKKAAAIAGMSARLRRMAFDLAVIFPRSMGVTLMCFGAGIPERFGFSSGLRGAFLTRSIPRSREICSVHQVHYYKKLLEPIGTARFPELPELAVPDADRQWADNFLKAGASAASRPTIGINPGSTYGVAKQWLPERFAELSRRLANRHGCRIIVFGDAASASLAAKIRSGLGGAAVDAAGRTGVLQLAALLARCDVLVTNDTGPMHVACAVGTPVAAVFGSTSLAATAPLGPGAAVISARLPCSPCLERTCPEGHHECMRAVTVEAVEEQVLALLESRALKEQTENRQV